MNTTVRRHKGPQMITVQVSMHKTNGSENIYLESDSAYSFQSCAKNVCMPAIRELLKTKKLSKNKCIMPDVVNHSISPMSALLNFGFTLRAMRSTDPNITLKPAAKAEMRVVTGSSFSAKFLPERPTPRG